MIEVTDPTWKEEVLGATVPVVVDVWAEWCPPCKAFAPVFEQLAAEHEGLVKCVKVNSDENPEIAQAYRITALPTLLFLRDGEEVGRELGARNLAQMKQLLELHLGVS